MGCPLGSEKSTYMAKTMSRSQPTYLPPDTLGGQPWWLQPVLVVVVLTCFSIYAIWAALQGRGYSAPYLSPFYSPQLPGIGFIPGTFIVLIFPLGFRATCYYYRKAYHRSFFWDPPACARPELRKSTRSYRGEQIFPWILNNLHRYFLLFCRPLC